MYVLYGTSFDTIAKTTIAELTFLRVSWNEAERKGGSAGFGSRRKQGCSKGEKEDESLWFKG